VNSEERELIRELIERSSLGTAGAKQLRARTPARVVEAILDRMAQEPPEPDVAAVSSSDFDAAGDDTRVVDIPDVGGYEIEVVRSVVAALRHFPAADWMMLQKNIEALAREPHPAGYETVVADFCRIRVEGYRIVYEVNDEERLITITHIGQQRSLYRRR
jgi:mRNA interferase RelE/StbE